MNWPFFRLNEEHFTFHLQYKHSGTFANRKSPRAAMLRRLSTHEYLYILYSCMHNEKDE